MARSLSKTLFAALLAVGLAAPAYAADKLIIYTSMKESLIGRLTEAFKKKNPDIAVDYQSAGAGKLMAKIAAERESGKIQADILWTSEVPDFYQMNDEKLLIKYVSPEVANIFNPFEKYDGSFTPIRLGTLGIAYNTRFVKTAPKSWDDLKKSEYKGAYGIADPALSGTSFMSVALLAQKFGWSYFEDLKKNGAKMGKGSGQVVDDTASGELSGSLAVDYITMDKIEKGASISIAYPPEMLVIPSPAAILKDTRSLEAAKKFIDFLLSKEGQTIIASEGTLPVRKDVTDISKFLPKPADAVARSIKVDYPALIKDKEATIKKFTAIMQGR